MRWCVAAACMLGLGLVLGLGLPPTASGARALPFYPLYAIDSVGGPIPNSSDVQALATLFSAVQSSYSSQTLAALRAANPRFNPVWYIDSDSLGQGAVEVMGTLPGITRRDAWLGLGYTPTGRLPAGLSSTATTFELDVDSAFGKVVSGTAARPVVVRVGSELMTLDAVKPAAPAPSQSTADVTAATNITSSTSTSSAAFQVTVARGFGGTVASAHAAGSACFSAVYDAEGYPNGTGKSNVLIVDPRSRAGRARLINHTLAAVQHGFAGSWFDCFSATLFDSVDMNGNVLRDKVWDFQTGQHYDRNSTMVVQVARLTAVFNATRGCTNRTGGWPTILANNLAGSYWPAKGGARVLLGGPAAPPGFRPLDGYSLESFAGREVNNDRYHSGCDPAALRLEYQLYDPWHHNVETVMDAAQRDLAAFPMVAQAGCKSVCLEAQAPEVRDAFETFAYASYLLAVESPAGKPRLGLPAFYRDGARRYVAVHPRYTWRIGTPLHTVPPEQLDAYIPAGHVSHVRRFSNGVVVVNAQANTTDIGIPLNGTYLNPETGAKVSTLDLRGPAGAILLTRL